MFLVESANLSSDAGLLPAHVTFDDIVKVSWNDGLVDHHLLDMKMESFDIKNGKADLNTVSVVQVHDLEAFSAFNNYMQVTSYVEIN